MSDAKSCNSSQLEENTEKPKLCPTVAMYGPYSVENLEPGKIRKWCTCGLSKKQPWCDGTHKGTGFKSLKWKVPDKPQKLYSICGCKHTSSPPFCDGSHIELPSEFNARQKACQQMHSEGIKLCTGCGWVPQW
ncbi:predicted protein [Nematostella vectensis]|uniref:Iron-binding zinc finger CDGSH type domain-containing protein n=1 Tax=Nematostella vectensis TaxID=45351 RepID=A7RWC5_NEMVE|nr:predicted protein [Nematostella vectensis]|eukprot:XP_001636355.1 predicted protein [Nematostella vectensis]